MVADVSVFFKRCVDDAIEFSRNVGIEPDRWRWRLVENRVEERCRGVSAKRKRTGSHFVQDGAKRKEISAGVEFFAQCLLRRHIGDRTQGASGAGQVFFRDRRRGAGFFWHKGTHLRQAEVEDLGVAAIRDEEIRRLDVAVNNALSVGGIESVGDFDAEVEAGAPFP